MAKNSTNKVEQNTARKTNMKQTGTNLAKTITVYHKDDVPEHKN